jgi:hypothetical protein
MMTSSVAIVIRQGMQGMGNVVGIINKTYLYSW